MTAAQDLAAALDHAASQGRFSGVVRVDDADGVVLERGYGHADRGRGIPNTPGTRFGVASVAKGFTALAVGSLIDEGRLSLDTPVRPVLGDDLPLVDDAVTVGHLLSHTSGIGDYLDESADGAITDYVMPVPVHTMDGTEAYLPALAGHAQVFAPGTRFAYNNSGFVVLALVAERVARMPFADLVTERVLGPAGMTRSGYPRTDEPADDLACGYLAADGLRTNVLHLPVVGSGDGGLVTTTADLAAFWAALTAGRIVSPATTALLTTPATTDDGTVLGYGRGFWIGRESGHVWLEGYDAGISAKTWYDPASGVTASVIANWSDGAWPVLRAAA